jgi:hypothetical protein
MDSKLSVGIAGGQLFFSPRMTTWPMAVVGGLLYILSKERINEL